LNLTEAQVNDLNTLATFLAADQLPPEKADLIVVLGSALVDVAYEGVQLYRRGVAPRILVCGGVGHSTRLLWDNVRADSRFEGIECEGRPEADILGDILVKHFGVARSDLLFERESTNCGANAICARKVLDSIGFTGNRIIVIQDPTMQQRALASFAKVYEDRQDMIFFSRPPFVPKATTGEIVGGSYLSWSYLRFMELALGEIPRFSAYGPQGTGFISQVDVPADVATAWERLNSQFSELVRA
jgi:uncharacterized SAM-binding protein YcdF (DUF218 family)